MEIFVYFLYIAIPLSISILLYSLYKKNNELNEEKKRYKNEILKIEIVSNERYKNLNINYNKVLEEKNKLKEKETAMLLIIQQKEEEMRRKVKEARADSIKRQRSILRGQATEHLAPYINSEYNAKDYRFFGNPIDFIIFDGLSNVTDGQAEEIKQIVFMDIKTGRSSLNKAQRKIKKAINDKKIKFEIYKPEEDLKENTNDE